VVRFTTTGLEVQDEIAVLGPGGREALVLALNAQDVVEVTGDAPPLRHADIVEELERRREAAERRQEPAIARRERKLSAQRSDARRWLDERVRALQDVVDDKRRLARRARNARDRVRAIRAADEARAELEALRMSREQTLRSIRKGQAERQRALQRAKFVDVEWQLLFQVQGELS
jgi:hypothetical protein